MADDDELGAAFGTVADLHQQCQLALWREGCLRLVEDIDAVGIEPLLGKGKEALTVGFLVIMLGGVVCVGIVFFFGGHIIEALRPQEIAAPRPAVAFGYGDGFMEAGVGVVGGEIIVSCAAFGIKTIGDGDRFQKRRLSAAVLPHEKGDGPCEFQSVQSAEGRDLSQIAVFFYFVPVDDDLPDKLVIQIFHDTFLFVLNLILSFEIILYHRITVNGA